MGQTSQNREMASNSSGRAVAGSRYAGQDNEVLALMGRFITRLDKLLIPLDRLALIFLSLLFLAVVVLAFDRKPPFTVASIERTSARPGEVVVITANVSRNPDRQCSASFVRYLFDGNQTRWYLDQGFASFAMIEEMQARTPNKLQFAFEVPVKAAPGQASVTTVLQYVCNQVQVFWPIPVTVEFPFEILPR